MLKDVIDILADMYLASPFAAVCYVVGFLGSIGIGILTIIAFNPFGLFSGKKRQSED